MQNIVMGGLAFLVAVVTMIAATLYLTSGDDVSTETALPAAGEVNAIEASATEESAEALRSAAAGSGGPAATLDVAGASVAGAPVAGLAVSTTSVPTTTASTSTTVLTTTTLATVTSAAPTSVTVATTAPLSEASTAPLASDLTPTSTTAPGTPETTANTGSSTTDSTVVTAPTTPTTAAATTTVATTSSTTAVSTSQTPTTADTGQLNDIEREILRLTNELRADPNGPLRRQGPVIDCGERIRVTQSGEYEPIGKVEGHLVASLKVARPWSAQMTVNNFQHQPRAGVEALQNAGIQVRSAGENIAYTSYPDKAQRFFTGWRESDGHFCNMMDPNYTHLGVGEVTKSDGISYATQNFFSLR